MNKEIDMLAQSTTAGIFHTTFDENVRTIMEPVRETLIESVNSCTREEIIAQVMMNNLFPHPCDPNLNGNDPTTIMTTEQKRFLVGVASHMGPNWAQALYHAAVFITKVA